MTGQAIDEAVALQWCQHQRPLLMRVLASFYHQYVTYLKPVALSTEQTQQLAHDLKSTAPSCGATALAMLANQLAPPAPAPDESARDSLLNALAAVLRDIEVRYPAVVALNENSQKDCLEELRQAMEQHNLRSLNIFKTWAGDHAQQWPREVVTGIQDALNSFDFKRARALLDAALAEQEKNDQDER